MHDEAATDNRLGVVGIDVPAAVRAHHPYADVVAAGFVQQFDGRRRKAGPLVAPLHQRDVDREQRAALRGEPVLVEVTCGMRRIAATLQDAVVDEPVEALGKYVAGQAYSALEVFEAPGAVERLAQDHPYPAFADDARGAGDRAILLKQFGVPHDSNDSAELVAFQNVIRRP